MKFGREVIQTITLYYIIYNKNTRKEHLNMSTSQPVKPLYNKDKTIISLEQLIEWKTLLEQEKTPQAKMDVVHQIDSIIRTCEF